MEYSTNKCRFCGKEWKNARASSRHERSCSFNPDRKENGMKGKTSWNAGLTKEADERVSAISSKVSETLSGRPGRVWTEEQRKRQSEWRTQLHKDYPEKHPNRKLAGNRTKMTYPERLVYDWLTQKGVEFKHQEQVDKYFVDFLIGKTIIEVDGEYWHDATRDAERDEVLASFGYNVKRFKAKSVMTEALDKLIRV